MEGINKIGLVFILFGLSLMIKEINYNIASVILSQVFLFGGVILFLLEKKNGI